MKVTKYVSQKTYQGYVKETLSPSLAPLFPTQPPAFAQVPGSPALDSVKVFQHLPPTCLASDARITPHVGQRQTM